MMISFDQIYNDSLKQPEKFWGEAAKLIDWFKPFDKVFDKNAGLYGCGPACQSWSWWASGYLL